MHKNWQIVRFEESQNKQHCLIEFSTKESCHIFVINMPIINIINSDYNSYELEDIDFEQKKFTLIIQAEFSPTEKGWKLGKHCLEKLYRDSLPPSGHR